MSLTLFLRDDCALCDEAIELLVAARAGDFVSVYVDADDDSVLAARYGELVPVLRDASGRELGWPFTLAGLGVWLAARGASPLP